MDVKQGQNKEGKTVLYLVFEYIHTDLKKYIRSFRQTGGHIPPATVKWIDSEGKTQLVVACMNPELYNVAKTLIELGANFNSYRPGRHAGSPLHHAAKRGLELTVRLLLSHGANALLINDDCQTPLDIASAKGYSNVVRAIEEHICLFSGWLRELYGPGILERFAPQLLSRKVWVVILPCGSRNLGSLSSWSLPYMLLIRHLYTKMMTDNKKERFSFVNPHCIPYMPKTTHDKTGKLERLNQRASLLADRLSGASVYQLVLMPCNIGFHWILTVIEPYKEVVYLLDSLTHRIRDEDWKYAVEMALRLFNSNKGRKCRKNAVWEVVKAPRQPDAKQCVYYVMRFMRQIIEEVDTIDKDSLRSILKKTEYSREEIDEVRSELAECIQDHIYE